MLWELLLRMKMLVPLQCGLVGGTWFTEVTSVRTATFAAAAATAVSAAAIATFAAAAIMRTIADLNTTDTVTPAT
jgi:hypothetical protein